MNSTILIIATLVSGLMAGLFYAWSISVTPGLAKVDNKKYLHSFQSMNRAIINPIFLLCFMGLAILLPLLSYMSYNSIDFAYVLTSTILYLIGVIVVTFLGNIPLNTKLESLKIESLTDEQMSTFRKNFESRWNSLNYVRTISSSLSFIFMIIACMQSNY